MFARGLLLPHAHADRGLRAGGLRRGGNRGARHRDDLLPFFHLGSDVTSVPACPPSPFAFAFDLFDRVAPTSTNRVRSTRRRSCAARVPSRADECAPRGVRALTKRSRAGEKSKKPKTRKISIVASKKKWAPKSSRAFGVGHLTNSFRRCSQYKLPISIQATYGFLVMITFFCNTNPLLRTLREKPRASLCRRTLERTPHAASPRERIASNVSSGTSRVSSFAARRCRARCTTGSTRAIASDETAGCFAFDRGFASSFARLTLPLHPRPRRSNTHYGVFPHRTHPPAEGRGYVSNARLGGTAAASLRSVPWNLPPKHARATAYVQYDSSTRAGDVVARHATKRDSSVRPD